MKKLVVGCWLLVAGVVMAMGARAAEQLPDGYKAIEYIESTKGGGQFIDTGYTANGQTEVVFDALVPERGTGQQADDFGVLFGSRTMNDWKLKAFALQMCGGNNGRNCVRFVYNGEYRQDGDKPFSFGERVKVTCDGKRVEWTGSKAASVEFSAGALEHSKSTLYIFADNTVSGDDGTKNPAGTNPSVMRLYSFKIYEDETLKRNFVPCLRTADTVAGLYDTVEQKFYENKGNGAFGVPPDAICTVTIGDYPNMTAAYTFGDGSVTNAVNGTSFIVLKGTENVKVIFAAKWNYEISGNPVVELEGAVTENIVFGVGNDYAVPTVRSVFGDIAYLDWDDANGKMTNATLPVADYELVTSETREFADGKWYVIADAVVIDNGANIKVNGSARLVLCDDASLTITNVADYNAAIDVSVSGSTTNSLAIYGQQGGSGVLLATGGGFGAGIGTAERSETAEGCGVIVINGGIVTATGGESGAGIGGGDWTDGGVVTINGGIVAATGGDYGAGIGGGYGGAGGLVMVNGGALTATGGDEGADIGGGCDGVAGMVVLTGGIFGMTVDPQWCAPGYAVAANVDAETRALYPWAVTECATVTVGKLQHMTAAWTSGDGSVTNAVDGTSFLVKKGTENVKVIFTAKQNYEFLGDPVVELKGAVTENVVFGVGNDYAVPKVRSVFGDITYLDWDDANRKMTNATLSVTDYELVTSETTAFADGKWYVVADDVVIDNGSNIKVNGSAHLILCDNASLTITNVATDTAAIDVSVSGSVTNALTIYGQPGGSGVLSATGGEWGAGIGSGAWEAGGTVTINGGTVTATGGLYGAGIGGGWGGAGGTVMVNGGAVKATGGEMGADIGGGSGGEAGTVVLMGGIFGMAVDPQWCAPGYAVDANVDDETRVLYPWTVILGATVTVGNLHHMTAAWTSGDGSVTNAVDGTSFAVQKGTENVKVVFTAMPNYGLEGDPVVEVGTVTDDIAFGIESGYLAPVAVCTYGDIGYLDWDNANGTMTNATIAATDYELVTDTTWTLEDGKLYVVADDVVIEDGDNIMVDGSAYLILCDGASLTVRNVLDGTAAVCVSEDNALTIYGQVKGTGRLTATGGELGAGIGGGYGGAGGTVTINGGTVTATGGELGAGIGGGYGGEGGLVMVNGGALTATGGDEGADIGGGSSGAAGTVVLTGGIFGMTVDPQWCAPGYAVAANGDAETKALYPWTVVRGATVTLGELRHMTAAWTSGDGSVTNPVYGTSFAVQKGTENVKVVFTADERYALDKTEVVLPTPLTDSYPIPQGDLPVATCLYPLVTLGMLNGMTAAWTSGDGSVTNAVDGTSFAVQKGTENVKVIFTAKPHFAIEGDPVVELGTVSTDIVFGDESGYAVPTVVSTTGDITYLDWDDENGTMTNATIAAADCELVTDETWTFEDGKWYVVADNVVIEDGQSITVYGSAHLILCDGASLTVRNDFKAAVCVSEDNALTIYGQVKGTGRLTATSGEMAAGIGGGWEDAGGKVTVNGGVVTATGGLQAAGIGGGWSGAGGTVTINGGTVTATGGDSGAGIGGGDSGAGGKVTVNGGAVKATGGFLAAGIGGGDSGAGGIVTINGGSLTATGGQNAAGIGGAGGDRGTVTFGAGAWLVLAGASAPGSEVSAADYANDHSAAYAHIAPLFTLKIPAGVHYSYVVSNETAGAELKGVLADGTNTYMVVKGATVKVYFTLDEDYMWDGDFDNPKDLGVIESDKVVDASEMPKGLPGSEVNPWKVGENVTAYIKDRVLYLKGTGAMNDFASAAEVPWAAVAGEVTAVMIAETVTHVGKNTFAGLENLTSINGEDVKSTYRTVSTVNGKPIEQFNMMEGALGYAPLAYPSESSALPSGAISGAEFDAVQIIDGKAYLDVSVYTNSEVKAKGEGEGWGVATNGVIEVPAPGKQGFFYLMSKPAVPSNKPIVPPPLPIEQ